MNMAQYPAIRLDNRVWLPTLQTHIWALYLFEPPYWAFKLIPNFYYFAAVVLLGMLTFDLLGRTRGALLYAVVLAFLFARQNMIMSLGMSLSSKSRCCSCCSGAGHWNSRRAGGSSWSPCPR